MHHVWQFRGYMEWDLLLFAKIQRVKMIYAAGKRMQRKTIGLSAVIYISWHSY